MLRHVNEPAWSAIGFTCTHTNARTNTSLHQPLQNKLLQEIQFLKRYKRRRAWEYIRETSKTSHKQDEKTQRTSPFYMEFDREYSQQLIESACPLHSNDDQSTQVYETGKLMDHDGRKTDSTTSFPPIPLRKQTFNSISVRPVRPLTKKNLQLHELLNCQMLPHPSHYNFDP